MTKIKLTIVVYVLHNNESYEICLNIIDMQFIRSYYFL
jgi:hypothetical protein